MSETLTLPVLPLDDEVVLPGMVVPIELSDAEVRGAVDAAGTARGGRGPGIRSEEKAQVLWCQDRRPGPGGDRHARRHRAGRADARR